MRTAPSAVQGAAGNGALVVFSGTADLPWLKILKPGFRHCFAIVESAGAWIVVNPLAQMTELAIVAGVDSGELADWYRRCGFRVVACRVNWPPRRPAPLGLYTCVEAVKRVLGIHARRVVTPWNLYKFLLSEKNQKKVLYEGR